MQLNIRNEGQADILYTAYPGTTIPNFIRSDLKAGFTQSEIAEFLSVHKSTISREIRRNRGLRGYRPKQTHGKAIGRKAQKVLLGISDATWLQVEFY